MAPRGAPVPAYQSRLLALVLLASLMSALGLVVPRAAPATPAVAARGWRLTLLRPFVPVVTMSRSLTLDVSLARTESARWAAGEEAVVTVGALSDRGEVQQWTVVFEPSKLPYFFLPFTVPEGRDRIELLVGIIDDGEIMTDTTTRSAPARVQLEVVRDYDAIFERIGPSFAAVPSLLSEPGARYADLLSRSLTGLLSREAATTGVLRHFDGTPVSLAQRSRGEDWPLDGLTMVGLERLMNLRFLLERVVADGVRGDFFEAGVWRGGSCIFARAFLDVLGATARRVFVADSFQGLPPARSEFDDDTWSTMAYLRVPMASVMQSFRQYGFLRQRPSRGGVDSFWWDPLRSTSSAAGLARPAGLPASSRLECSPDGVCFVPGFFNESMPAVRSQLGPLAVLRVDGDMYDSTMDVLDNLYDLVSPGGFVVLDDYNVVPTQLAVRDFLAKRGLDVTLVMLADAIGAMWRKPKTPQ